MPLILFKILSLFTIYPFDRYKCVFISKWGFFVGLPVGSRTKSALQHDNGVINSNTVSWLIYLLLHTLSVLLWTLQNERDLDHNVAAVNDELSKSSEMNLNRFSMHTKHPWLRSLWFAAYKKNQCLINVQTSMGLNLDTLKHKEHETTLSHQTSNKCSSSLNSTWIWFCPKFWFILNYCLNSVFIFVLFWQKSKRQFFRFLFAIQKPTNRSYVYWTLKIKNEVCVEWNKKSVTVLAWSGQKIRLFVSRGFRIQFSGQILTRLQTCALAAYTRDTLYVQIA